MQPLITLLYLICPFSPGGNLPRKEFLGKELMNGPELVNYGQVIEHYKSSLCQINFPK